MHNNKWAYAIKIESSAKCDENVTFCYLLQNRQINFEDVKLLQYDAMDTTVINKVYIY